MPADPTPAERLAEIRTGWPDALKLAEPLALAARIEPELVRDVRLALFPKSDASLEAALYFSPLVAQRTPQWLVLDTALAHELQNGLASAMKRRPKARPGIRRVRELVERAHASIPFEIAREEEMIWLAVERPHGKSGALRAINDILQGFLSRLKTGSEHQAFVVARWFASAVRRLPLLARETPAFEQLGFVAGIVLGGRKIDTFVSPTLETFEALTAHLPPMAKRTTVWAGLTTRGLHIVPRETTGYQPFQVPLMDPVLLEARVEGEPPRLVIMDPGQPLFVPLSRTPVALRTLARDLLTFRPRGRGTGREAAEGVDSESGEGRKIYVSYAGGGDARLARRLAGDLKEFGHSVWIDLVRIADQWTGRLRVELEASDCVVVILNRYATGSRAVQNDLRIARERGIPVIGAVTSRGLPDTVWPVPVFVDFGEARAYQEGLSELQKAILDARRSTPGLHGVPELPAYYVHRPELLHSLHEAIRTGSRPVAIAAPSVGKTSLAAAYARSPEARDSFPDGIAWFGPGQYERAADIEAGQRLFIFDDVSNADTITPVLQSVRGRGHCLLTTRDEGVAEAVGAQQFVSPALTPEEALTVLAMASGQPRDSLPTAARRIADMSGDDPANLAAAGTKARNGMSWEQILEEWSASGVHVTPMSLSIVLAKKGVDGPTFNLDCELNNRREHTQKIDLLEARLTDPHGVSFSLRWTVFYQTSGLVQRRTRDAGPFEVAPGEASLGIQFVGPPSMSWIAGTYVLELSGWLAGAPYNRTPSFSESRDMFVTAREEAELSRWSRASDAEWAGLDDEAIAIPVRLSAHAEDARHPWPFRISADRFVEMYSRHRPLRESERSGLYDFIERLNEDRDITGAGIAAYILATVQDETGGAFRPIEQRVAYPSTQSSQKISENLGNIEPGDVERYRGRGYILIEGRTNYRRLSESLNMEKDLMREPELLLDPNVAYQALRFVMLQGGLTGHPLKEFIQPDKADYIAARRVGFGSSRFAERVAKEAEIIERFLRDSLVPRDPSPG